MAELDPTQFPQRMRALRERRGLKPREAAEMAGLSVTRWRHLERGFDSKQESTRPSREAALNIAITLNWDIAEALAAAGLDPELNDAEKRRLGLLAEGPAIDVQMQNDPDFYVVATMFPHLPRAQRHAIRTLVESMMSTRADGSDDGATSAGYTKIEHALNSA